MHLAAEFSVVCQNAHGGDCIPGALSLALALLYNSRVS